MTIQICEQNLVWKLSIQNFLNLLQQFLVQYLLGVLLILPPIELHLCRYHKLQINIQSFQCRKIIIDQQTFAGLTISILVNWTKDLRSVRQGPINYTHTQQLFVVLVVFSVISLRIFISFCMEIAHHEISHGDYSEKMFTSRLQVRTCCFYSKSASKTFLIFCIVGQ